MADRLDLTKCPLAGVRRRAAAILESVAGGTHPLKLGGQIMKSMNGSAISVPVGLFYRLLFSAETLQPVAFMTHEQYNKKLRRPLKQ